MAKALPRIPPLSWRNFQTHEEVQQQQRLQDQLQAQRMNRGLDFSSSSDLQTSVMPPYDNPHFILQLNPEHFLHSFWNKVQLTSPGLPHNAATSKQESLFPGVRSHDDFLGAQAVMTSSIYTPEEQLLYKMVDEFPLQRPQGPASLPAWTLTGHFYILLGMHDLAFMASSGHFVAMTSLDGANCPDGESMANLHTSPRSALLVGAWSRWMVLQAHIACWWNGSVTSFEVS